MLVDKKRISLDRPTATWINDLTNELGIVILPISPQEAIAAGELKKFQGDPADRLIYSSALFHEIPLISKDKQIHTNTTTVNIIW